MSTETEVYTLPPILDLRAAAPLKADLAARVGGPIDIDASKVERLGGLCLQVLIASAAAWQSTARSWRISGVSEPFREDVRLMGADALLGLEPKPEIAPC